VEADPVNAALLRHHVKINGFADRVTVFEMAATECTKEVVLYRHAFNQGESNIIENGRPFGAVHGKALDSLNLPPIDICKMDVEGAELMALQGMEQTLKRSPHIKLMVEYAQHLGAGEALLNYLRSNFSSVRVIEQNGLAATGDIPPFCNLIAER
jgi:FkbM family methyltransferase